eukprot:scaffold18_cov401-Prasinococcus_capsulatus_cf.AAC.15
MEEDDVDQAWHSAFVAEYCTVLHTYILPVAEYVEQLHQKDLECKASIEIARPSSCRWPRLLS